MSDTYIDAINFYNYFKSKNKRAHERSHHFNKSHGDFGTSTGTGTDIHNLKPADVSINSAKSNLDFAGGGTVVTDNSPPSGYSGTTSSKSTSNSWEPPDGLNLTI